VNISAIDLRREDFARTVRGILAEAPIAPVQLELEVTESVLFDDEELFTKRVRQLREIGVRISIDDFGTRYTGFNVLLRLPLAAMRSTNASWVALTALRTCAPYARPLWRWRAN